MISDLHLVTRTADIDLLSVHHWITVLIVAAIVFLSLGHALASSELFLLRLSNWLTRRHRTPITGEYMNFRRVLVAFNPIVLGGWIGVLLLIDPVNTEFYLRYSLVTSIEDFAELTLAGYGLTAIVFLFLVNAAAVTLLALRAFGLIFVLPVLALYLTLSLAALALGTLAGPLALVISLFTGGPFSLLVLPFVPACYIFSRISEALGIDAASLQRGFVD